MIIIVIINSLLIVLFKKVRVFRDKLIRMCKRERINEQMRTLYSEKEADYQSYKYIEKNIMLSLIMLLAGSILAYGSIVATNRNPIISDDNAISRNDYGKGDRIVSLYIDSSALSGKEKVNIAVSDQKYTVEETEKLANLLIEEIDQLILGDNTSLNNVTYNLNLISSIEGYPFKISWRTEKPTIISRKGIIDSKRFKEELEKSGGDSLLIRLYASLSYEDYEKQIELAINLCLAPENSEKAFLEAVEKEISLADERDRESGELKLPTNVNGSRLDYSVGEKNRGLMILILSLLFAVALFYAKDEELNKQVKERNEQLEDDYPRIINQYTLYYCAGMNTKSIWREICSDYRKGITNEKDRRYAYEEMLRTEAAMADGVGENTAYSEFAKNCRLRKYRRFASLLQQALTKGKDQMAEDLRKEAEEASSEKVRIAMIRGEEAGTKLLIPMFMMLGIVLIVVIVPAFVSFGV